LKESRSVLIKKDEDQLLSFQMVPMDRRCPYLVRSILWMRINVVFGTEEEKEYNSLIRSCIYNKAQMLKMNQYEEYGQIFSGQTEFVLKQVYSGDIKMRSIDMQQYKRYSFTFRDCTTPDDGELLCDNCHVVKKHPRRLCRNRYHLDNKGLRKNKNTSTIYFASPTKAKKKIGMVAELLLSSQQINWYLKSRLEEQREKRGNCHYNKIWRCLMRSHRQRQRRYLIQRKKNDWERDFISFDLKSIIAGYT